MRLSRALFLKDHDMATVTLQFDGMTCQGCVASVTRVLMDIPGVANADVVLQKKAATVNFNTVRLAVRAELVEAHAPFDRLRVNALKRTALR